MNDNSIIGWLYLFAGISSGIYSFFVPSDPVWMLGFLVLSKLCFIEEILKEKNCDCSLPK